MSSQGIFAIPPQPFSGPDAVAAVEANYQASVQMEANGQTPPPLTAGSAPVYGANGNSTGQQALGQAAQLSVTMLSQFSGPVLGLGFNAAMALGSAINGDGQGALSFAGQAAMNVVEIAALLNPCGLAAKGLAAYGLYQATLDANQNGLSFKNFLLAAYNLAGLIGACFTGDMLLSCEGGKKRADAIREGDQLWSRDEHDPDGPLVLKRVLRVFQRTAKVWHVRVAGQVLRTTIEHPFWVENRQSWLPVGELRVGDMLRTDAGELLAVEGIEDSGRWEKVYNWEVEDYHTYFVSASEDAPSVWAHNQTCFHYTDEEGFNGIAGSGIIRANNGKVFMTLDILNAATAEQALFAGNPAFKGKGNFVVEFTVRSGVTLNPGTQPNEFIHFGSLRNGRHIDIIFIGPNPF